MRAGCLWGDARSIGKFGSREGASIEKRRKHGRSCRLSDQPSNLGDERASYHVPI
jgi:hypothetical protein